VLALLGAGGFLVFQQQQERQRQEQAAAEQAAAEAEAAEQAARAAAKREEAEQAAAAEVKLREYSVKGIEKSVTKMARGHASDGFIEGWPKRTECTPKAGQNIENLNKTTTSFNCFVITQTNSDGTSRGHYYHALMNWDTGRYTYGYDS